MGNWIKTYLQAWRTKNLTASKRLVAIIDGQVEFQAIANSVESKIRKEGCRAMPIASDKELQLHNQQFYSSFSIVIGYVEELEAKVKELEENQIKV